MPPSFNDLPHDVQKQAELALTTKQLDVFKLLLNGWSDRRISFYARISIPTVREHRYAVERNLERAGIRWDNDNWRIEKAS